MRNVLIAATMLVITSQASAGVGTWYEDNQWIVEANPDYRYCTATTTYNNGRRLSIAFMKGKASLFIGQTDAVEDQEYKVLIANGAGMSGHFVGRGIGDGVIVFDGLLPTAIYGIAKGRRLYVHGIGSLEMTGSYKAITKTIECEKAMRELL